MRHGAEKSAHALPIGKLPVTDQPAQLIKRLSVPLLTKLTVPTS